ncbi:hypothetical protein [Paraburkholderia humisilvae]|uniref:Uncharacterized protein n=1 Tax=Paraburkholderia humisilvae TaxID=627669 RepID=A0A6J5E879_9BURK|nr:hypothetical protein [Paraburkholderia humisilvae]CAB3762718.1 hypothetical protein LMG29542_04435 [Paraburkholderia humisilvae]
MKQLIRFIAFMMIYLISLAVSAEDTYQARGRYIDISNGERDHTCLLDREISSSVESFDKAAVIVSGNGYVPVDSLKVCPADTPVHVFTTPQSAGILVDVSLNKNLYVAVDIVTLRPMGFLATVACLNSTRNLVNMLGAYVAGRKLSELKQYAFSSSGEPGSAAISPDGRYVAPAGQIFCDANAWPSVWDIEHNRKVLTDEQSCRSLFYPDMAK